MWENIKNHPGFIKYFKNTLWLFSERILRMVVGFFVGVWVARYLGPEQFGLFSYALSLVGIFTAISTLGLDGILVRELVKNEGQQDKLIGTAFWLKFMGAIATLVILAISVNFTSNDDYTNSLVFIIASATIFQSFNVVDLYFQAKVLSKFSALTNSISLLISSIFKIVLILNEAPLIVFVWVVFFDSIVLAIGFIYFFIKNNLSFGFKNLIFETETAISLLKDSWPLILGSIAASIYMQIDQVMIKEMMGNEAVGYYAVSARLSDLWLFIAIMITKSFLPAIISAKKISEEVYLFRLQYLYDILLKIAFLISLLMVFFAFDIVTVLYGEEFLNSVQILIIYIWSIVFVYLSNVSTSYFLAENMQFHASFRLIIGAIINIVLNVYFIKYYGLIGAAYATLISYAISGYIYNMFFKKTFKNFIMQTTAIVNIFNIKSYKILTKIR
jgi:O-antigen/teichoic acid export membrane protein